jgi:5-methylthioadenosine/S-adenosylhomocysteine deaminase
MATRAGALSQGREDCGDIAEGYRADLVMMNFKSTCMNPRHDALANVLYAAGSAEVAMTVVDGRVLYRDGTYPTLDIEKIVYQTNRCVEDLLAR